MLTVEFPGCRKLIDAIDTAVSKPSTHEITDSLRNSLCQLIRGQEVKLPDCVFETIEGRYARRELYRSEDHDYCVVAMTWGPGQGTPIHDHCGMWCVEGVWSGALEVVQYERLAGENDQWRFQPVGSIQAGPGSAGSLIPPHEYHTIRNPSDDAVAVSLHIYSGPMTHCAIFKPVVGATQCYERTDRQLGLDPVH
ncbi:putative metal-dependent enzyme (double-stranded beta helix superfamily) [Dyella sp. SG562]|jgi:predicted metal-dependent enzyme (double-stranded beta helix superfamily)|uniref:cysteine dioxygenase family protein n=1 Tax=Dyella TaxID=231454 RepID=UPI0014222BA8|nr:MULTISPECIES: cysteine dioxygenase family protein [unclassified Dyella]MBT2116758.1 cysteine dioxygenase family protein [Dyella sp. LX-1]MBT2139062.1 cysteine dioxygenase family protein [Dyella sp. LX-66]NII75201.1 putative metal-dependent enzyme (double-stranded beta helix superfamily) [Dyella sp. SG562]NKJ20595.1 putative metal-dependent enzyme (double-stranded beta helix superfamily) [Dyella sp. SG609]